ncbi:flagellar assembly protein FliX [Thalassospira marina]|uniref:Flagellar assembly protein FliX n=1 Tax=Thalassospira marina TaxID=2048283 RepID=A0A2N3KZD3_9PROT|nr:flagellar assembly protein FliX [Thalassospira marina]AUG52000.1 flagellar assembly protein FliX [Thalassospira marina]PKR55929.1 flagellar assembly protein FliX [Thalassospira marina]
MKVSGSKGTTSGASTRKASGTGGSDQGFANAMRSSGQGPERAASAGGLHAPSSVSALDALLALQQSGDALDSPRKRSVARAKTLLDQLDRVRNALLGGGLPASQLAQLVDVVGKQREEIDDPALAEVLDEIELRARVELAKLDVAGLR